MMEKTGKKLFVKKDGRIYFSRDTERRIFFVMTLVMLCIGITVKLGIL